MADLAELQSQLDAAKSARASGVRELWFGERRVTYRSDKEMATAISALEDEIAALQGTARVRNVVLRPPPYRGW
jgi:tRNA A37 methylthiotransferase MiaB